MAAIPNVDSPKNFLWSTSLGLKNPVICKRVVWWVEVALSAHIEEPRDYSWHCSKQKTASQNTSDLLTSCSQLIHLKYAPNLSIIKQLTQTDYLSHLNNTQMFNSCLI